MSDYRRDYLPPGHPDRPRSSTAELVDGHELAALEARLAALEDKVARAEAAWLRFLAGAGRRLLRMLGIDPRELQP